jgi:streptogramin lyase
MSGLVPGTEFAGHRIDSVAGRGGMGVVYRATQMALERVVALKLIVPELADDPGLRERFERESRIAASIDHPNVLPLYYAGEHEGVLFQAMRYVDGTDLRTLVRAHGALPPQRAVKIVAQVAAALDAAHAHGLVHRDVKPANVMLTGGDHAYLGDFGLSRRTASQDASTRGGSVVGTFDYVAPEQIRGERVDARADVYALGGVLFTALTGQVPFPRESDEARLWAHLQAEPPRLSERYPGLPAEMDSVIERALAKRPEERYLSAGDLARAATAALKGSPVSQPERLVAAGEAAPVEGSTVSATIPVTPPGARRRRRPRRRPLVLAGLAAAAVAAGVAAVALIGGSGDEPGAVRGPRAPRAIPTPAPVRPAPTAEARVTGRARTVYRPALVALAGQHVWVASFSGGLMRISRTAMNDRETLYSGRGVGATTSGFGWVWVARSPQRVLERLDPRTGQAVGVAVTIPHRSKSLAVGAEAIWSAGVDPNGNSTIARIDPSGARATDVLPLSAHSIAARGDSAWVVSDGGRRLYEVRANPLRRVHTYATGANPDGVAVGAGAVWVADQGDDTVMRLDLRSRKKALIHVPDGPAKVAVRGNSIWVTCVEADRIARIDARTHHVVTPTTRLAGDPYGIAIGGDFLWVTQLGRGAVARVAYRH